MTPEDKNEAVEPMLLYVCGLCRLGAGGECHVPGCAFYLNRAPDLPLAVKRRPEGLGEAESR